MTAPYRILRINLSTGTHSIVETDHLGPIDAGVELHLQLETYNADPLTPGNPVLLGWGRFTLTPLFGSHRIVAVFRSPISMGLHASTMGGAAYAAARTGVDAILVEGRCGEPCILEVLGDGSGQPEVRLHPIEAGKLWTVYNGYKGYMGTRALHAWIGESILAGRDPRSLTVRILTVGPAAWRTRMGGIISWNNTPGSFQPGEVVDGASRGGGGSVLAQAHNVAAVILGGSRKARGRLDGAGVLRVVEKVLGDKYTEIVARTTTKYRYDPKLGTGGTFGVNYVHYRELLPALAYNTIYMSRPVRLSLHEKIMRYFWRPFQEEVFESKAKPWRTCGEPCSVACKKLWRGVKLDYEPAHGLGPMIGVITLSDAAGLVERADDLGLDAIEAGHIIAWIFDSITRGLLTPDEAGLPGRPVMDPLQVSPETSRNNAILAQAVMDGLIARETPLYALIAREGARRAAQIMDEQYQRIVESAGVSFRDLLVYAAFGERGYMTPNYYWSPGMIAPLYVLGRYWTNYSPTYMEPEEYARNSLRRAMAELEVDNAGMCRFHRKWGEKVLQALYNELAGASVDLAGHSLETYRNIAVYNRRAGAEPVPWESRKTMDVVATIAAEIGVKGWESRVGDREALLDWWARFKSELDSLLGLAEA
ncbi:MAG: aldehyde ferredoxin oxidoreductase [Desulfurococcales archaeon]|nr:aldehyde ferredoxin oxidoreductase [Desulfurococcales archaeon]